MCGIKYLVFTPIKQTYYTPYHSLNAFKTKTEESINVSSLMVSSNQVDILWILDLHRVFMQMKEKSIIKDSKYK